jgi:hypothetical protein
MKAMILLFLELCVAGAAAAQPALWLQVESGPTPALLDQRSVCDGSDVSDAPARAIRLVDGTVQLYATDQVNRVNTGPDLLHLEHRCAVVYRGSGKDDPADYDDRSWIASPWTPDGRTIWAVVHNEFHGHLRAGLCPTGRYMDCWFNALTLAVSHDGGRHFERALSDAIVAALPYRFNQVGLGHHGYFSPSNIVSVGGYQYMFAFATTAGAQKNGNCLLRTDAIERAHSWRGWDGAGFVAEFVDPYTTSVQPEQHVCAPVDVGRLRWPVTSLVRHAPSGLFIALMLNTAPGGGVFYATSPDLLSWSVPALLLDVTGRQAWRCGDPDPIAYPSLLDPESPSRNFETVGAKALLFATRFEADRCKPGMLRRLQRWIVTIETRRTFQPN